VIIVIIFIFWYRYRILFKYKQRELLWFLILIQASRIYTRNIIGKIYFSWYKLFSNGFGFGISLGFLVGILSFISIQFTLSIFLDFFQNKIFDDKSKDGALWSILCFILPYKLRIQKKNNEKFRTIQSIFKLTSFCVEIYLSWCMYSKYKHLDHLNPICI